MQKKAVKTDKKDKINKETINKAQQNSINKKK